MIDDNDSEITGLVEYFWDLLKTVHDPELGVNVVDLGLIYAIDLKRNASGGISAAVEMTLTTVGCPLADVIAGEVKTAILSGGKCSDVSVNFVFDPPWNADMMTAEGKMQLGLF
ncbi:MAG: metal-sulfur cluster assembly factor [Puniceicoccales bacterium]|jgi:metal-sulfur cluster biosynthetic enzyme|nr:metal-sulfur cluster assembly factor [Puniceicoccales bacterium]